MAGKQEELYDILNEGETWGKALTRFRAKGMSEAEISKQRAAWKKSQEGQVKSLSSKSKGK